MDTRRSIKHLFLALVLLTALGMVTAGHSTYAASGITLTPIGTYDSGVIWKSAAEIVTHDPATQRLFVVNADLAKIDVLDVSDPTNPTKVNEISVSDYGAGVNSVAFHGGVIAAAVENEDKQAPGMVAFFDANGSALSVVTVGALPDMLIFTPDGQKVLVANEGEPNDDYTNDPEGSVSIIDVSAGAANVTQGNVTTASFAAFNDATLDPQIRIFGPGATVAQDVEPEYIAVAGDSKTAWVSLQENNALAILDIEAGVITELVPLGFKDHSLEGNGMDVSNKDGAINITTWPVKGMYMPDAIASYEVGGQTYILSANEGDSRDYDGFSEEERVKDLVLDATAFPNAADLQQEEALGRLKTTTANGDTDGDGEYEEIYSYGARSFSVWDAQGRLVFDSGDDLEEITAAAYPDGFNSDGHDNESFDDRSDDKGPEPEGLTIGLIEGRTYAFIGLERIGGIMVYDVTDPTAPNFVQYVNTCNFDGVLEEGTAGDVAPEGLTFIPADESPNGKPLLVVAFEVSGTTTIFEITEAVAELEALPETGGNVPLGDPIYLLLAAGAGLLASGYALRRLSRSWS
jgi:DNA-binding beta-propeller fold protein YncE